MEVRTLEEIKTDIQQQLDDICEYMCSRGDTVHLRGDVRRSARGYLHALSAKGWKVTKKEPSDG